MATFLGRPRQLLQVNLPALPNFPQNQIARRGQGQWGSMANIRRAAAATLFSRSSPALVDWLLLLHNYRWLAFGTVIDTGGRLILFSLGANQLYERMAATASA